MTATEDGWLHEVKEAIRLHGPTATTDSVHLSARPRQSRAKSETALEQVFGPIVPMPV